MLMKLLVVAILDTNASTEITNTIEKNNTKSFKSKTIYKYFYAVVQKTIGMFSDMSICKNDHLLQQLVYFILHNFKTCFPVYPLSTELSNI